MRCPDCKSYKVTVQRNMMGEYYTCEVCNYTWMDTPEPRRPVTDQDRAVLRHLGYRGK